MKKYILTLCSIAFICTLSYAQNDKPEKKDQLDIKMHEESKAEVYIDGIKYDPAVLDLIDTDKIATINVIKGEKALEVYNAPNGVIVIVTKENQNSEIEISGETKIKIKSDKKKDKDKQPLIIIDGKVSSKKILKKLSPDSIESINVIKGEKALEKYDAPHGVIEVTTKGI
jgi:hypothetical protein